LTEICQAIDEAVEKKQIENVLLSGGEPTIHPNFFDVVEYITQKGLKLSILTNAMKLADAEFFNRFLHSIDIKNADITIAFHSHIEEKHDALTQHKGSFRLSLNAALNLADKGIRLSVKNNIINYTCQSLPEYVNWVNKTFPESVTLLLANIDVNGVALRNKEKVSVHFTESMPYLAAALDIVISERKKGLKRNVKVLTTPLCLIDPYYWGFIENQTQNTIDAYKVPFMETENSLLFDVSSDSGPVFKSCESCDVKKYCPGTWRSFREIYDETILKRIYAE
jgi:MoaA/NifB/PqqE/SkfB family radical SAM enzyme